MLYHELILSQKSGNGPHHSISLRISTSLKRKAMNAIHISLCEPFCKSLFQDRRSQTKPDGAQNMNRFMSKFHRSKPGLNPGVATKIYSGQDRKSTRLNS